MQYLVSKNPVMEALEMGMGVTNLYIQKGELKGFIRKIEKKAYDTRIKVEYVDKRYIEKFAKNTAHQGVMAKVPSFGYSNVNEMIIHAKKRNEDPFSIILDEITDPHNLGPIVRTVEVAGCHGVIIPEHRACEVNATATKTSTGAIFSIKIARVTNITTTVNYLKEHNIWIYRACGEASQTHTQASLKGPIGLVIGSEGKGIPRLVRENCDQLIRIPMYGKTESLSASSAANTLVHEIIRQRYEK